MALALADGMACVQVLCRHELLGQEEGAGVPARSTSSSQLPDSTLTRQEYHGQRQLAIASAAFLCLAWIVSDATISTNYSAFDWYAWVGIYGVGRSLELEIRNG